MGWGKFHHSILSFDTCFVFLWWALDFILDCQSWSTPCFSRIAVNRVRLFPIAPWKWLHLMIFTNLHFPMVFLWFSHSNLHFPMVFLWFSYGFPIQTSIFLWFSYGFPIQTSIFLWFSYGFPIQTSIFLWFSYGLHSNLHFPMVFLWFSIQTSIFLWFSYGFPMVFPFKPPFSYGFPMVSQPKNHRELRARAIVAAFLRTYSKVERPACDAPDFPHNSRRYKKIIIHLDRQRCHD